MVTTRNWKSTLAFFIFVGAYIYSLLLHLPPDTINITGYIALWSSVFMMLRNDMTPVIIEKLIDAIGGKKC